MNVNGKGLYILIYKLQTLNSSFHPTYFLLSNNFQNTHRFHQSQNYDNGYCFRVKIL